MPVEAFLYIPLPKTISLADALVREGLDAANFDLVDLNQKYVGFDWLKVSADGKHLLALTKSDFDSRGLVRDGKIVTSSFGALRENISLEKSSPDFSRLILGDSEIFWSNRRFATIFVDEEGEYNYIQNNAIETKIVDCAPDLSSFSLISDVEEFDFKEEVKRFIHCHLDFKIVEGKLEEAVKEEEIFFRERLKIVHFDLREKGTTSQ